MGTSATPALVSTGALCLAVLLSSCAGTDAGGSSTQEARPAAATSPAESAAPAAPTPAATPTPSTAPATESPAPPAAPTADGIWTTYTTTDGTLAFDHPADWTVADAPETPPDGIFVVVEDPAGRRLATLRTNLVTGAVCPAELPYALLDSQALPALAQDSGTPRFTFEGRTDPAVSDPVAASILAYGITSAPEPTGESACPISHFFTWPPSGAAFGGVYDPFEIYPGKPQHVDTPEAYMETEEYQDLRTMITSLRPAG
ncbi:hypothetical protein [Arthrobacter sp. NPDC092385]|uniref:hypothetical protein n=1 Tax=Arthrobacter sp. NPDC092385 TaxID=3363943 RepID=UPI00382B2087